MVEGKLMGPLGSSGGFLKLWEENGNSTAAFVLGTATEHLSQEGGLDCIVWPGSCLLSHSRLSSKASPIASS